MTRNAQDIIDDMRNIVKPRIAKMLLEMALNIVDRFMTEEGKA